jgi:uncharacterized MnhB-related membrane protein
MTTIDNLADPPPGSAAPSFGHRLAPAGDPLEGAGFDALYDQRIRPELVKREAERRAALQTFVMALVAGALVVTLEYLMLHAPDIRITAATMIGAAVLGYLPLQGVARKTKVGVIEALCDPLGLTYSPTGDDASDFPSFLSLNLLPHPDGKSFQDFFAGRRGAIDFALCEATLTQGSGRDRHTVFQGQLLRLQTSRRLASTTVVLRNSGWLNRFECPHGLEAVGLEDPHFNQAFAVFGSDQVEAREILTPSFMQQLADLESAYAGAHLRCAFAGAQLLVAMEGKSRFEIGGMFTTLVERSRVEGIARDLEQVFKLIDELEGA